MVLAALNTGDEVEIVPVPLALIVRFVLVPESMTAIAAVPPEIPAVILIPDFAEAVEASIEKTGLVAPLGPTANAVAPALVATSEPVLSIVRTVVRAFWPVPGAHSGYQCAP